MDDVRPVPTSRSPRLPTIAGYTTLVWSRLGIIVIVCVLGGLVGFLLDRQVPRTFEASASVELPNVPTSADTDPDAEDPRVTTIDSTAQLLFSRTVLRRVAAVTNRPAKEVNDGLAVSAYPLSRVLIVTFEAGTPGRAVAGANEAARALIARRRVVLPGSQLEEGSGLLERLRRLRDKTDAMAGPYNSASRRLQTQITQIASLRQTARAERGRVVDRAYPAAQVDNHGELQVTNGVVLGLLLGVAYAWWSPGRRRMSGGGVSDARRAAARRAWQTGPRSS